MKKLITLFITTLAIFQPKLAFADDVKFTLKNTSGFTNLGPLIQALISILFAVAGLLFLIYFFLGGLSWITSNGDPKALAAARSRIVNALIGLVIVAAGYAIILIVEQVLGIRIVSGINIK